MRYKDIYNEERWQKMYLVVTTNPDIRDTEWIVPMSLCLAYRFKSIWIDIPDDF